MEKFRKLGLSQNALEAIEKKGFTEPTEIQEKTIPVLLKTQKDIIAQAQTGTGKTASFGLIFVDKLSAKAQYPQAIVLAPTRELAVQVAEEIDSLKGNKNLKIAAIYGGQSIDIQLKQLRQGVDIVVGTPGRVMDHLRKGTLDLQHIRYFILDEADEMLNMGFIEDIEIILDQTHPDRQLLLFSATMPRRIADLAKKYMKKDHTVIQARNEELTADLVEQMYCEVYQRDKFEVLCRFMDVALDFYGIIFCKTKVDVDHIVKKLNDKGYQAEALHGDIAQNQRERILQNFKDQATKVLVATDVAARGIDVNNLTHVINYSLPQDPESYVHRVGRTGRAGNKGTAMSFVSPTEFGKLNFIKKITGVNIQKVNVPTIQEVINLKKKKIIHEVQTTANTKKLLQYDHIVTDMVGHYDPNKIIAALLDFVFAHDLDENKYQEIHAVAPKEPHTTGVRRGEERLFISLGKRHGANVNKILHMLSRELQYKGDIGKIKLFDNYSLVTLPQDEVDSILQSFKKSNLDILIRRDKGPSKTGGPRGKARYQDGGRKRSQRSESRGSGRRR